MTAHDKPITCVECRLCMCSDCCPGAPGACPGQDDPGGLCDPGWLCLCGHPLGAHYLGPDCASQLCRMCECDDYGEAQ